MPSDWLGCRKSVTRSLLFDTKVSKSDVPLISYGYDKPEAFGFLDKTENKKSITELHKEATYNLRRMKSKIEFFNDEETGKIVLCEGDFFSATKLLDEEFMMEMHEKLETSLLAASVPRRNLLIIGNGNDHSHLKAFCSFKNVQYEASFPPLSSLIFIVSKGKVSGIVSSKIDETETSPFNEIHSEEINSPTDVPVTLTNGKSKKQSIFKKLFGY